MWSTSNTLSWLVVAAAVVTRRPVSVVVVAEPVVTVRPSLENLQAVEVQPKTNLSWY